CFFLHYHAAHTSLRSIPSRRSSDLTLKIQMNAATLMNSGTVTKNPVTKLRRNHDMARAYIQPAATAASSASPSAMRYQANGAKRSEERRVGKEGGGRTRGGWAVTEQ